MLQSEFSTHPKSKILEPAVVTPSESPLTVNSEATHRPLTTHESPQTLNDSTSTSQLPPLSDGALTNRGQVAARLSKLTIPMFGGDSLDRQPFGTVSRQQFTTTHS